MIDVPTFRNRSTGQTTTATGAEAKRLTRLEGRWERLGDDDEAGAVAGSSNRVEVQHPHPDNTGTVDAEIGSADVDVPVDDPGAEARNADVAGELDTSVPTTPPAAPAGDVPDVGDRDAAVADVTNVDASSSSSTKADDTEAPASTSSRKRTSGKRRSS